MREILQPIKRSIARGTGLFILLFAIHTAFSLYMILTRRMPDGHDGGEYLLLQYSFLNNAVFSYEIPQWMPYITQGMTASWFFTVSAGITQNFFFLIAPLLKGLNFLFLFHVGIFIDELLLLVGTWLLARRTFQSPLTVFFVSASVLGSCIWMNQVWFAFHFVYAVPMLLFLGHEFFETGKWKNFLIATCLLVLQCLGNLPYYLPIITWFIFSYFVAYFLIDREYFKESLERIKIGFFGAFCLLFFVSLMGAFYCLVSFGIDQTVFLHPGRLAQGVVDV